MWFSLRTFLFALLMAISAAAYLTHPLRVDYGTVRESRSMPDFDTQYANNFYRGYGSTARFGPDSEYTGDRYW